MPVFALLFFGMNMARFKKIVTISPLILHYSFMVQRHFLLSVLELYHPGFTQHRIHLLPLPNRVEVGPGVMTWTWAYNI